MLKLDVLLTHPSTPNLLLLQTLDTFITMSPGFSFVQIYTYFEHLILAEVTDADVTCHWRTVSSQIVRRVVDILLRISKNPF